MGWASDNLSPLSQLFVEFCGSPFCADEEHPVLDIGAAFGVASLAAVRAGAFVIANDLEASQLPSERARLRCKPGRFPREIHFEPETLSAVHASNVFHFLTGNQLEQGIRAIARWLRPSGKLFVQAATPYQAPFAAFIPEYERRIAAHEKWPGWIPKLSVWSTHRQLSQMPRSIHLLDDRVLARVMEDSGLLIERAWLYRRSDLPATLHLGGCESVGVVARKPEVCS
jgi:SAM-dependent methyltransferase